MPVSEDLPYQWFDTPNMRFFTIADFEALCVEMGIVVRERMVLDDKGSAVNEEPNFLGSLAVYRHQALIAAFSAFGRRAGAAMMPPCLSRPGSPSCSRAGC